MADKRVQIEFVTMGDAKATLKEMAQLSGQAADAQERLNKAERDYQSLLRQRPGIGGPGPVGGAGGASDIGSYGISYSSSAARPTGSVLEAFGTYSAIRLAEGQKLRPEDFAPGRGGANPVRRDIWGQGTGPELPVVHQSSPVSGDRPLNVHGTAVPQGPHAPHGFGLSIAESQWEQEHDWRNWGSSMRRRGRYRPPINEDTIFYEGARDDLGGFFRGLPGAIGRGIDTVGRGIGAIGRGIGNVHELGYQWMDKAFNVAGSGISKAYNAVDSKAAAEAATALGGVAAVAVATAAALTALTQAAGGVALALNSPYMSGEQRIQSIVGQVPILGSLANAAFNLGAELPPLFGGQSRSQQQANAQFSHASTMASQQLTSRYNEQRANAVIASANPWGVAQFYANAAPPRFNVPFTHLTAAQDIAYNDEVQRFAARENLVAAQAQVFGAQAQLHVQQTHNQALLAQIQAGNTNLAGANAAVPGPGNPQGVAGQNWSTNSVQAFQAAANLGESAATQLQLRERYERGITAEMQARLNVARAESAERQRIVEVARTELEILERAHQRLFSQMQGFGGAGIGGQVSTIAAFQRAQIMAPQGAALPGDLAAISAVNPLQAQYLAMQNAQNSPLFGFAQQIGLIEQGSLAGIQQQIGQQRMNIATLTREDTAQLSADIRDSFVRFGNQLADTIREAQAATIALIRAKLQMGAALQNAG